LAQIDRHKYKNDFVNQTLLKNIRESAFFSPHKKCAEILPK